MKIGNPTSEGKQASFYEPRAILLTTGCFESPRAARRIPGTRPAGIFTTGALQNIVNCQHTSAGRKALIIGSEHVALSSVLTLRRSGTEIVGLVEEGAHLDTYSLPATVMKWIYGFPIYKKASVKSIIHRFSHNQKSSCISIFERLG